MYMYPIINAKFELEVHVLICVFYLLVNEIELVNCITRKSIDLLKENYWNDLQTTSSAHVLNAN